MWSELKHAVKDECTTLEKAVTPVPTIVLNDMVGLGLDPEIERDQGDASDPTAT
jgi:hypothetical protein